jgi:nucleotide-binding universal stress UspA family protein
MQPFNVVVAFDDRPASWLALEAAARIARAYDGTVTIVHAVQPRLSSFDGGTVALRALETARGEAMDMLAQASDALPHDVPSTAEVVSGNPADAIVRRADELGADLIVVGSHRRGPIDRLLVGSVSEAIVRSATSPVLVVPRSPEGRAHARDTLSFVQA